MPETKRKHKELSSDIGKKGNPVLPNIIMFILVNSGLPANMNKNNKKKKDRNVGEEVEELLSLCCYQAQQAPGADRNAPLRKIQPNPVQLSYYQKSNKLAVTTSDNRRYAVDEELRPVLLRYLATSSCGHEQQLETTKKSSSMELHSRIAEELQVFFDSVIAILILNPSRVVLAAHDYVCSTLRTALMTDTLFPLTESSDPLSTKLEKLDRCVDAASISSKVVNIPSPNEISYTLIQLSGILDAILRVTDASLTKYRQEIKDILYIELENKQKRRTKKVIHSGTT
jgi:hypothetical protein